MTYQESGVPREPVQQLPVGIGIFDAAFIDTTATSVSGRLVAESGKIIRGDMTTSKHPGSRYGKLMNEGTLREVASVWADIVNGLAYINFRYFNGETPEMVTVNELRDMSAIALNIPNYLFFRAKNPLPKKAALPTDILGINRVAIGMGFFASYMGKQQLATETVTPEDVYRVSEGEELLVGGELANNLACPAPQQMIIRAASALIDRDGNYQDSNLPTQVPDFENLIQFGITAFNANRAYDSFCRQLLFPTYDKFVGILKGKISPKDRKNTARMIKEYEAAERELLVYLNGSQVGINNALGRDPSTAPELTPVSFRSHFQRLDPKPLARQILNI